MNYLKIIIHFTDNAPFQDGFKSYHHSLFYSVVRLINKNNWRKTKIDLGQILCMSGLSKPTYIEARKWLIDNKWIEVTEGKNAYQMAEFSISQEVVEDSVEGVVEECIEDIVEDNIFTSTHTSTISSTLPINNKLLSNKADKHKVKENYTKEFEDFWILYEKPTGKVKSFHLWKKLSDEDKEKIPIHVKFYKKVQPDPKFRKDPERYFTNRLWEDFNSNPTILKPVTRNESIDTRSLFGEPA